VTINRPSKLGKPFVPRKFDFSAEDIASWRDRGWSWPRIARKYGCHHTTLMHAAMRLGRFGDLKGVNTRRPQEAQPQPPQEWPASLRFEDAKVSRFA
jgi:hypothetical protein